MMFYIFSGRFDCIIEEIGVILFRNPSSSSAEIMLQTQSLIHLRIPINKSIDKHEGDTSCSTILKVIEASSLIFSSFAKAL